jgi:hypothetical protein
MLGILVVVPIARLEKAGIVMVLLGGFAHQEEAI